MEYKKIFQASYQNPNKAKKTLEGEGYTFDTELSTPESKVFIDARGNPNIAYRGTHTLKDIGTDIMVGLGKTTNRERQAKQLRQKVEEKYGKPATAYGTSLGGKLAESSGAKAITYNRAYGVRDIFKTAKKGDINYRNPSDIISLPSMLNKGKKPIMVGKKTDNILFAHSVDAL